MVTYIYADLLFFINLFADYLILYLTSKLTLAHTRLSRLACGAATGAVFGTLSVCTGLSGIMTAILILAVPLLMCFIAFGRKKAGTFLRLIFYFYLSSSLLYGGMYAMQSFLSNISGALQGRQGFAFVMTLLAGAAIIYILASSAISRSVRMKSATVKIELCDGCRTYTLRLLCDTGNLARDPFSGKPVTVISKDAVDNELYTALSGAFEDNSTQSAYRHIKPRVIPVKTVSGTSLLYAFIPENMSVYIGNKKKALDSIIAIDTHSNAFLGNDGIISGELLEFV